MMIRTHFEAVALFATYFCYLLFLLAIFETSGIVNNLEMFVQSHILHMTGEALQNLLAVFFFPKSKVHVKRPSENTRRYQNQNLEPKIHRYSVQIDGFLRFFTVLRLEIEFREHFGHFLIDFGAQIAIKWIFNFQKIWKTPNW